MALEREEPNKKAQAQKTDKELSLDELEAVSGGVNRDYNKHGCAATVEAGSGCPFLHQALCPPIC